MGTQPTHGNYTCLNFIQNIKTPAFGWTKLAMECEIGARNAYFPFQTRKIVRQQHWQCKINYIFKIPAWELNLY